jgi:hypothetical protein
LVLPIISDRLSVAPPCVQAPTPDIDRLRGFRRLATA